MATNVTIYVRWETEGEFGADKKVICSFDRTKIVGCTVVDIENDTSTTSTTVSVSGKYNPREGEEDGGGGWSVEFLHDDDGDGQNVPSSGVWKAETLPLDQADNDSCRECSFWVRLKKGTVASAPHDPKVKIKSGNPTGTCTC
jgi:hypothetical protein